MKLRESNRQSRSGSFWYENPFIRKTSRPMANTINEVVPEQWFDYIHRRVLGQKDLPAPRQEINYEEAVNLGPTLRSYAVDVKTPEGLLKVRRLFPEQPQPPSSKKVGDSVILRHEPDITADGILLANTKKDYFAIPIPMDLEPVALRTKEGRVISSGVEFQVSRGLLLFDRHPSTYFEGGIITVLAATLRESHIFDYAHNSTHPPDANWISNFFKYDQSVPAFLRALASASGLAVLPEDSFVRGVFPWGYVFDWGVLYTDYTHTRLHEGVTYPKGTVIGDLSVSYGTDWWKHCSWPDGLPVGKITGFGDLTIPNEEVTITAQAVGADIHVSVPLGGAGDGSKFWEAIWAGERSSGNFMAGHLGLTAGQTLAMNGVDFFMEAFGYNLIRFNISGDYLNSRKKSILRFINENRPVGCKAILQTFP